MSDVTIITHPDILYNDCFSILLVCPSQNLRTDLQDILRRIDIPVNVYLYTGTEDEPGWFLNLCKSVDVTILDLDNVDDLTSKFTSHLIAQPNTHYNTEEDKAGYHYLSKNRFYDLTWFEDLLVDKISNWY